MEVATNARQKLRSCATMSSTPPYWQEVFTTAFRAIKLDVQRVPRVSMTTGMIPTGGGRRGSQGAVYGPTTSCDGWCASGLSRHLCGQDWTQPSRRASREHEGEQVRPLRVLGEPLSRSHRRNHVWGGRCGAQRAARAEACFALEGVYIIITTRYQVHTCKRGGESE